MRIVYYFLFFALLSGCISPPDFPDEPVITYSGISKTAIDQGSLNQDEFSIYFSFTDGDGDIGLPFSERTEANKDMVVIDTRTGDIQDRFHMPFVPPKGTNNGIQGSGEILIFTTCCLYEDQEPCSKGISKFVDEIIYEVYVIDRSGNESNHIFTDPITLRCI